jgi:GntR family transcriptional regulator
VRSGLHFYLYDAIVSSVMARRSASTREARLRLAAVNRNDPTLLHEQVAVELRRAIAQGEARPGDRIPQAKDLAAVLGVNTNTVLRALRILRDQGLLEVGRGRAIRVAGTPERTEVIEAVRQLVELGQRNGYRRADLAALLEGFPGWEGR